MNGAEAAAATLHTRVAAALDPVRRAILNLRAAQQHDADADALDEASRVVARTILAAEMLRDAASGLERIARDALAECMADTGSMGVRIEGFAVTPSTSAAGLVITGAVPPEWMTTPAPAPDKKRIAAALREGETLPFATLGNSRPTVSFRAENNRRAA